VVFFFFQAEDGIRDFHVTGVQTCALPISAQDVSKDPFFASAQALKNDETGVWGVTLEEEQGQLKEPYTPVMRIFAPVTIRNQREIGRASCRERAKITGGRRACKKPQQRRQ